MPDLLSPDLLQDINELAAELIERFTPPEYIPGCTVKSIADKDEYAQDNGWIECLVAQHNQQRCRWRGQYTGVAVDDVVDVLYFKSYRLFVVFGQGGAGTVKGGGSGNWPAAGEIKLNGVSYTGTAAFSDAVTAASANDTIILGSGTFKSEDVTLGTNITVVGAGRTSSGLSSTASDVTVTVDATCVMENMQMTCTSGTAATGCKVLGSLTATNVGFNSATSSAAGTSYGLEVGATSDPGVLVAIDCTTTAERFSSGTAYGLYAVNEAANTLSILGGDYYGDDEGVNIVNGSVELSGPLIEGGVGSPTFGGSATLSGYYFDVNENAIVIPDPGYINHGGEVAQLASKTGAYTLTSTDWTVTGDATGGTFAFTLPAAASHTGRVYNLKKIDASANAITVDGNASETIDGATTQLLSTQYDSITLQSDGTGWHII